MKKIKRALITGLTVALLASMAAPMGARGDESWAGPTLRLLADMGLVDANMVDNPSAPLVRGQLSAWIAQASGLPPINPAVPTYRDLPASDPFYPWIEGLSQLGAVHGYPDGTFRTGVPITRAELAVMVLPLVRDMPEGTQSITFTDIEGHWGSKAILEAASKGLLHGYPDGSFRPDQNATVAEGAMVLIRLATRSPEPNLTRLRLLLAGHSDQNTDSGEGSGKLSDGSGSGSALGEGLQRGHLVTAGQMAAIVAANYFGAPEQLSGTAAVALLRQNGLVVKLQPDDPLTIPEFTVWVQTLKDKGLLSELSTLDANVGAQPTKFAVDLQVVRDALDGTLLPKTAPLPDASARCAIPLGIQLDDPSGKIGTGILNDDIFVPHSGPKNHPPVAAFQVTKNPIYVGDTPTVADLSFDPDGDVLSRIWIGKNAINSPGIHAITLVVYDPSGLSSRVTHTVEVKEKPNNPPVARFEVPSPVFVGDRITYTDQSTDPDGDLIEQRDWQGAQDQFASPGTYPVTLRVQDSRGNWSLPYTQSVAVLASPAATATLRFDTNPIERGKTATLLITPSTPADTEVLGVDVEVPNQLRSVPVTFGDGQTVTVSNPSGPASGSGSNWSFKVNVPWSEQAVPNDLYTFTVTVRYRTYWSYDHRHYLYDAQGKPILDANGNPEYTWHTHSGSHDWSQTDRVQLGVSGQVQVIMPGSVSQ